jgi:hypothetical protein
LLEHFEGGVQAERAEDAWKGVQSFRPLLANADDDEVVPFELVTAVVHREIPFNRERRTEVEDSARLLVDDYAAASDSLGSVREEPTESDLANRAERDIVIGNVVLRKLAGARLVDHATCSLAPPVNRYRRAAHVARFVAQEKRDDPGGGR